MCPSQKADRMTPLDILFIFWVAFAMFGALALYIGYGFVMCAKRANDAGLSPSHVVRVDSLLALPVVILDGMYNALILPVLCLDFRLNYAFKMLTVKGVTFPFFELVTERFSRYSEDPNEWRWRRWVALTVAPFLNGKDPKGWHIRKANNG